MRQDLEDLESSSNSCCYIGVLFRKITSYF